MSAPLLEAINVRLMVEHQLILEVEQLALNEGQILGVMGPNGAGKSTLLKVLASLQSPSSGEIKYRGQDLRELDLIKWRRRTAMVFQEPLLLDTTVFDNVATGLKIRGVPPQQQKPKVNEWLEKLNINHLAQRSIRYLSGGEAQRVSLARAFVLEPEILFLDEPFSSLDSSTRENLLEEIEKILRSTQVTTVFVTHRQSEAFALADTLCRMDSGRITGIETLGKNKNPAC